jgi:hypothetical protein
MSTGPLTRIFGATKPKRSNPGETIGVVGVVSTGGWLEDNEKSAALVGTERYRTYSELLSNVSIVAAGVRYFLNLVAKAEITVTPSENDTEGKYADLVEDALKHDSSTPLHRMVRRAAMYRFYGFSIQEHIWKKHEDGHWTLKDVAPRAQRTIEQWDMDDQGNVSGAIQIAPRDGSPIYLPRDRIMYLVDDTLSDSPEGLGLFRHLVAPAKRLQRYEQLEGLGFDNDLRGMPVLRGPIDELRKKVNAETITKAARSKMLQPIVDFANGHVRGANQSLILDSETYAAKDDANRPSNVYKWSVELLKGDSRGSLEYIAAAIDRINREIARIMGVEQLLLGDGQGSYALSKDKTNSFFLIADSTLKEVIEAVYDDLVGPMFRLNGWPEDMMPTLEAEAIRFQDIEKIVDAISKMASAGAILAPDDPAINEIRALLGLSPAPEWDENDNNIDTDPGTTTATDDTAEEEPEDGA